MFNSTKVSGKFWIKSKAQTIPKAYITQTSEFNVSLYDTLQLVTIKT